MIKGAIFDVDGTLLDSLRIWDEADNFYLESRGLRPEPMLGRKLFTMSMEEGALYVKRTYGLPESVDEILEGVLEIIREFYRKDAALKPGADEFLRMLEKQGVKMAVATSSDRGLIEAALERLGVRNYFQRIFTCSEVGAGKNQPDIYWRACECLGTAPGETWVFEDAVHALVTAKQAGFLTCGVYDAYNDSRQEELQAQAHIYMKKLDYQAFLSGAAEINDSGRLRTGSFVQN